MLEKTTRINFLFDFYQELLTPKQRSYMEMYYLEDFSLGEISESFDVSRQAVYDNIRRTEAMLETYEDKLRLYEKFIERKGLVENLETKLNNTNDPEIKELVNLLKDLD